MVGRNLVILGILLVPTLPAWSPAESSSQRAMVNKLLVERVEIGLRLGEPSLRVRLHLQTGQALDHELAGGTEAEYFLELARLAESPGARMFAEVTDGELVGIQTALP